MNIIHGECLEKMKEMESNSVDSIVTDPPYGLSFMGKKWDYDVPKVEIWKEANTYTTSMAIKKTIELKTLKSLLSQNTLINTGSLSKIQPNCAPITMARKPLEEKTIAKNVLKYGTGGINIDGCRVETGKIDQYDLERRKVSKSLGKETNVNIVSRNKYLKHGVQSTGRFPANLIWSCNEDEYVIKSSVSEKDILNIKTYYENKKPQVL